MTMSDWATRTLKGIVIILALALITVMVLLAINFPEMVLIDIGIVAAAYILGTAWETVVAYGGGGDA